jgi:hypothetical protein
LGIEDRAFEFGGRALRLQAGCHSQRERKRC